MAGAAANGNFRCCPKSRGSVLISRGRCPNFTGRLRRAGVLVLSGLVVLFATALAPVWAIDGVKREAKIIRPLAAEYVQVANSPEQVKDLQSTGEPVSASLLKLDGVIGIYRHGNFLPDWLSPIECTKIVSWDVRRQTENFRIRQWKVSDINVGNELDLVGWRLPRMENVDFSTCGVVAHGDRAVADMEIGAQLPFAGDSLGGERFFEGRIRVVQNGALPKYADGSGNNEKQGSYFQTSLYAALSLLLFSIGFLLVVISVLKSRDSVLYSLLHILTYPLWFAAIWFFSTGVLGWHLWPLAPL